MSPRHLPVMVGPAREVVAKAFQLLLSTTQRERGKTKSVSSFRAPRDVVDFLAEHGRASGLKKTDVYNGALSTFVDFMKEAAPHAALLSILAEHQQCSPAQLVVRLALEKAAQDFPHIGEKLSAKLDSKPKK